MRKSLSLGIKDVYARLVKGEKPGNKVHVWFSDSFWGPSQLIGTVLVVHTTVHGSVVLVQNHNHYKWDGANPYAPPKGFYTGGPVVALWISECGGSGVMITGPKFVGGPVDQDYLDALEAQRRRDADNCWAC